MPIFCSLNGSNDVHHVHQQENLQEAEKVELEKHISMLESIIEQAKENAG
jgi:hypothetical protein